MKPVRPKIIVPGDRADGIMARTGWISGYGNGRVVWQFGFLPDSPQALAYGVSVDEYIWVLAKPDGAEVEIAMGVAQVNLPAAFQEALNAEA